jgi:hypothetical protein
MKRPLLSRFVAFERWRLPQDEQQSSRGSDAPETAPMWPQEGQTIGISMPSYFRVCRVPGQPNRRRWAPPRRTTVEEAAGCIGFAAGTKDPKEGLPRLYGPAVTAGNLQSRSAPGCSGHTDSAVTGSIGDPSRAAPAAWRYWAQCAAASLLYKLTASRCASRRAFHATCRS